MKLLVSPTKTFNRVHENNGNEPLFLTVTKDLVKKLSTFSLIELRELYNCSEKIAEENASRFLHWKSTNGGTAIRMYGGEVFKQLNCENMTPQMVERMKSDVLILSGLYGILRAEDRIQAYRLDLKEGLSIHGKSLIEIWKPRVTRYLNDLEDSEFVFVGSQEYEKLIDFKKLATSKKFVRLVFMEQENHIRCIKGMYAKTARGKFVRFLLENQIDSLEELKTISIDSYLFDSDVSDQVNFVYVRTLK